MWQRAVARGPVVVDLPKGRVVRAGALIAHPTEVRHKSYRPQLRPDPARIAEAVEIIGQGQAAALLRRVAG